MIMREHRETFLAAVRPLRRAPALEPERLSSLPDGRVAYRLRRARKNGATHLVLEPIAFMARLVALAPPPRYPLLRLPGVHSRTDESA
jgi:hypothetical protein